MTRLPNVIRYVFIIQNRVRGNQNYHLAIHNISLCLLYLLRDPTVANDEQISIQLKRSGCGKSAGWGCGWCGGRTPPAPLRTKSPDPPTPQLPTKL